MKTALKAVLYIAGFLLMAAGLVAIVMYIMGFGGNNDIITSMPPTADVTPGTDGTTIIDNTQQNGTNSVTIGTPTPYIPTPYIPTPSPTPETTPTPTAAPTPTPQAAGIPLGGGTLSSNTGKWIDVDAVWSAETVDNAKVKVTVSANLRSYRLQLGASRNALEIVVGSQVTTMDVEAMTIETDQEVTTELGTYSFTVDAPIGQATTIPVKVNWHFGGVYSGTQLDVITAEGNITIGR